MSRTARDVALVVLCWATSRIVALYGFGASPTIAFDEARRLAMMAVDLFWQESPLPRASMQTGHYETITGADSLALALLEVHAAVRGLDIQLPLNTIDR